MSEDRCICCGAVIPEGVNVCPSCLLRVKPKKDQRKMATEKRLIDANELLRDAEDYGPIMGGLADMYDVKWLVDAQFTVDAVEVKHGEWVVCGDGKYVPFICSACGKTTSWYHKQTANYCPNCGADMRERKDNEN